MRGNESVIEKLTQDITTVLNSEKDFYNVFSAMMISTAYLYESRLQKGDNEWQKFTSLVQDSLDVLYAGTLNGADEWKLNEAR